MYYKYSKRSTSYLNFKRIEKISLERIKSIPYYDKTYLSELLEYSKLNRLTSLESSILLSSTIVPIDSLDAIGLSMKIYNDRSSSLFSGFKNYFSVDSDLDALVMRSVENTYGSIINYRVSTINRYIKNILSIYNIEYLVSIDDNREYFSEFKNIFKFSEELIFISDYRSKTITKYKGNKVFKLSRR